MRRGEIREVDLDPGRGSMANKRRPAVIVSNDPALYLAAAERAGGRSLPMFTLDVRLAQAARSLGFPVVGE